MIDKDGENGKKCLDSVLIELRLTFRSVLVWVALLSVLAMLFQIIYSRVLNTDIGGALTSTAAIVQCGILLFNNWVFNDKKRAGCFS